MGNFNWNAVGAQLVAGRYGGLAQGDVIGVAEWERFLQRFPFPSPADAWPFLQDLHRAKLSAPARTCPRVFVSHRHSDAHLALRVAWLAHQEQVEYWLDVIDIPKTFGLPNPLVNSFNGILLIAALIEMALINCTHVLAVMTPDTAPSRWVPYEYGRIKDDPPGRLTASCWRHPALPWSDLPEYLHLAPVLSDEAHIRSWLQGERYHFTRCRWMGAGEWEEGDCSEPLPGSGWE